MTDVTYHIIDETTKRTRRIDGDARALGFDEAEVYEHFASTHCGIDMFLDYSDDKMWFALDDQYARTDFVHTDRPVNCPHCAVAYRAKEITQDEHIAYTDIGLTLIKQP